MLYLVENNLNNLLYKYIKYKEIYIHLKKNTILKKNKMKILKLKILIYFQKFSRWT